MDEVTAKPGSTPRASRLERLIVGAMVLAVLATACGDGGTGALSSVTGPSGQASSTASTSIDGRCVLPGAPAGARVVVNETTVRFAWSPVGDSQNYVVAVGTTAGGSQTLFTSAAGTTYEWSGVAGNYYARIHAHNRCGTSEPSTELSFSVQ